MSIAAFHPQSQKFKQAMALAHVVPYRKNKKAIVHKFFETIKAAMAEQHTLSRG